MIQDGQSAIDSLSIQVDGGEELTGWDSYTYSDRYDANYPQWSFSVAPQTLEGVKSVPSVLRVGAKVTVRVNGLPLCTGYIDERQIETSGGGGTKIKISGRDILGPVDDACMDPRIRWSTGLSIAECLLSVLSPFGVTSIVNGDELDLAIMTGRPKTKASKTKALTAQVPSAGGLFTTSSGTFTAITGRVDLTKIKQDAIKPKIGEGCKDFLARITKRYGFAIRALSDGTGVMATVPRFDQPALYKIYHDSKTSNIRSSSITDRIYNQPSVVVGLGKKSGGDEKDMVAMTVIALNELVAFTASGAIAPHVHSVLDRYPHALVAPVRPALKTVGFRALEGRTVANTRPTPLFFESQESKTSEQLLAATKRELARLQSQAIECRYQVLGFSQGGIPWTVNTIVDVQDDISGIYGPMWVKERTFNKSSSGGTTTDLVLIRPYTMEF